MNLSSLVTVTPSKGTFSGPLRACIVSSFKAGIGTANRALAKLLAMDGDHATLLCTDVEGGRILGSVKSRNEEWRDELGHQADRISLEYISHHGPASAWLEKSWRVMEFVGKRNFDLVYFDDCYGSGYYSLLAKRAGLAAYTRPLFCVVAHASKRWVCEYNDEYFNKISDIEVSGIERRSVELADVLISPSRYMVDNYEHYGWNLPKVRYRQFYPLLNVTHGSQEREPREVDELVFFGRLETRKGVWMFCEALDRLADRLRGKAVTFLGAVAESNGISASTRILDRASNWPFRVQLLPDLTTDQAIGYLSQGKRMAVMPSIVDNSPCVVYECLQAGVPFISTLGSGTSELIDPKCWPDCLVEPRADALADGVARVLDKGAKPARASFDASENLAAWSAWHRQVAADRWIPKNNRDAGLHVTQPAARTVPLLYIVDDGLSPVGTVLDNLAFHLKRFGSLVSYAVVSSRRSLLESAVKDLFQAGSHPPIPFFDSRQIEDARRLVSEAEFAFFMDADVELLTPFFVLALDSLVSKRATVVTCIGAARDPGSETSRIERLPSGDLPGLSALGVPIGGPVWATAPSLHPELLTDLKLIHKRRDRLLSASAMGQLFMHRCQVAEIPVELIPTVGAVAIVGGNYSRSPRTIEETRSVPESLGGSPSLASGGAPWFAATSLGIYLEEALPPAIQSLLPLPDAHPLQKVRNDNIDLPALAAALGRPELSLQLEASEGKSGDRFRDLVETAVEARRNRPVLDLLALLRRHDRTISFGHSAFPLRAKRARPVEKGGQGDGHSSTVAVYLDDRVQVDGAKIRSTASLGTGGPAKLFFFDTPLRANSSLNVRLRSKSRNPIYVRVRALDQQTGDDIGAASGRIAPDGSFSTSIPLYEIFGFATIVVEISGSGNVELVADELMVR